RWEPRRDFEQASRKLRNLYNDVEGAISCGMQNGVHIELGAFSPRVDISETKENVFVRAELPGMKAEDVKITLSEGTLTLRGNKKRAQTGTSANRAQTGTTAPQQAGTPAPREEVFHRLERSHGQFARQFVLPDNLNEDAIEATFADGVLEITIPKRDPEKPKEREISINV
ncbi:MAG TPA: Hsp20/alpha crystallin family protein, partial [Candidatus Kapabacteria bacterium]|nr:Hsp20/alpha crystallin family protein [Candidatus Kapabacteria bacterium]